jgi:hypothetical protein
VYLALVWLGYGVAKKGRKRFFLKKEAKTFAHGAAHRGCKVRRAAGARKKSLGLA